MRRGKIRLWTLGKRGTAALRALTALAATQNISGERVPSDLSTGHLISKLVLFQTLTGLDSVASTQEACAVATDREASL